MGSIKNRIVAAAKYNPQKPWRRRRLKSGHMEKRVGDLIILEQATIEVTKQGHVYREPK